MSDETTGYVEDEDFVPNASDMTARIDTTGLGGATITQASTVFAQDRIQVAQQVLAALDPDDDSVPASAVMFSDPDPDPEQEEEDVKAWAEGVLADAEEAGVPIPPTPAEQAEADEEAAAGDDSGDDSGSASDSGSDSGGTQASTAKKTSSSSTAKKTSSSKPK